MKKHKPIKFIAVLPSAITLLNGFFGISAILIAGIGPGLRDHFPLISRINLSYLTISAWMIVLSMAADALDGSVARASGFSSDFGAQLDSLCDVVSFGVAPALLSYKMFASELANLYGNEFRFSNLIGRWVLFCALFYALCALVRLARFNVETDANETSHMSFAGLPSPAAAGLIIGLVLFHEQFASSPVIRLSFPGSALPEVFRNVSLWSIPFALLITGLLMVSRVAYPHIVNYLLHRKRPFTVLVFVLFIGLFAIWNINVSLLLGFLLFCVYGVILWLLKALRRSREK